MQPQNTKIESSNTNDILGIIYFKTTDIWKRLCEEHYELFNLTCNEYSCLLGSDLDQLDEVVAKKQVTIARIGALEDIRQEIVQELNQLIIDRKIDHSDKITSASGLLLLTGKFEAEGDGGHLRRFNALLIDIIEKIQGQNKKNQLFLNKAILSLQEIRDDASGDKSYSVYTSAGGTTKKTRNLGGARAT